jgi:hypothetical protein
VVLLEEVVGRGGHCMSKEQRANCKAKAKLIAELIPGGHHVWGATGGLGAEPHSTAGASKGVVHVKGGSG